MTNHADEALLLRRFGAPDNAEAGRVGFCGIQFAAARWVEDDVYVVTSLEFDISGQGDDWDDAFRSFFDAAGDLVTHLAELSTEGKATPHEKETASVLGPRIAEAYQRLNEEMRREIIQLERKRLNLKRRSHHNAPSSWDSRQILPNSSRLLPV